MELSLATRTRDGCTVVEVGGELDVYTAPRLRERLIEIVDAGARSVVVDLSGVAFHDSTGLGVEVGAMKRLRAAGGRFALVCPTEPLRKIFRITSLDQVIPIFYTMEEATAWQRAPTDVPPPASIRPVTTVAAGTTKPRRARRTSRVRDPAVPISVVVVGKFGGLDGDAIGRITTAGVAGSGAEAEALLNRYEPDVAIVSIDLPDGNGIDLARSLRASRRALGVVIVASTNGDQVLLAALNAGASALILADSPVDRLAEAVRHAANEPHRFAADGLAEAVARSLTS